jgi:hypothetical protein
MSCNSTPRLPKSRSNGQRVSIVRYAKAQTLYSLHLSVSKIPKSQNSTMSISTFRLSQIRELRCHATLLDFRNSETQNSEMVLHLIVSQTRQEVSCPSTCLLLLFQVFSSTISRSLVLRTSETPNSKVLKLNLLPPQKPPFHVSGI